uniref:Nitroreductase n=1 Tax=Candidatus Kentrum sp. TUN TaxID=2126343 RepID=A0A451AHA9_9GAMM|nr:MAG: Nitroreductase [Candidatus Kentron sp. TUN]VFK60187.1 MAG: Nitroreductase [Candidatus Kentron sp. TUN]VFK65428.1 MAG: Nitroreductase [Candidatus Kentron sp. TUN]
MRKNAKVDYPVHDLIERRWSPRAFADRPVDRRILGSLFEAARWAASCHNEQPWRFMVATREEEKAHDRLSDCLMEANRVWAQHAPVLVLCVVKRTFTDSANPNRCFWHDLGAATTQLIFQAMSSGLHVHPMAGILSDKVRDVYGIPEDFEPVTILAMGYLGHPDSLPDSLKERETASRTRKPLTELVFADDWGTPARFS